MNRDGLESIGIRGKVRKVMSEAPDHYRLYPNGFIAYKKHITKIMKGGKVGVYDENADPTGRVNPDVDQRREFVD